MFRKLFIALSIAAITAFLTPQIALAEMDRDHKQGQRASDSWSACQLPGPADDIRDQRASNPWCRCQLPGLSDDFRDRRSSPDVTMTTSPGSPQ
jgi:hypothetical protein